MRGTQRRRLLPQRRDRRPRVTLVRECVGIGRRADLPARRAFVTNEVSGKRLARLVLARILVVAREALHVEVIGEHVGRIDDGLATNDRGRSLRIPLVAVLAHPLHANRPAEFFGNEHRVHRAVAGIGPAVGPRTRFPDRTRLACLAALRLRHARLLEEQFRAVRRVVRLLRVGPDRYRIVPHVGDGRRRRHPRMALERPLVLRIEHTTPFRRHRIHVA